MTTQFTFARRPHPVGETAASFAPQPPASCREAADYFHPNHSSSNHSTTNSAAMPSAAKISNMGAIS